MLSENDKQNVVDIATTAGNKILTAFRQPVRVSYKSDHSPVTPADLAAHKQIVAGLTTHFPDIPIISEEGPWIPYEERASWDMFWLVDPIDGTQEFISGRDSFVVSIALIRNQTPVFGVIAHPSAQVVYLAQEGEGSYKQEKGQAPILLSGEAKTPSDQDAVIGSRSDDLTKLCQFLSRAQEGVGFPVEFRIVASALKFGKLAEGYGQCYPRFRPTMAWDIAAGEIITSEAGFRMHDWQGKRLEYNTPTLKNEGFLVERR